MSAVPALPGLPRDAEGPVFAEPWQAQAFAMAVALHDGGVFSWSEWAQALGDEIARAGPNDAGAGYWDHWLAALEALVVDKGAASPDALDALKHAWDRAARATPHGAPIELDNDPERLSSARAGRTGPHPR